MPEAGRSAPSSVERGADGWSCRTQGWSTQFIPGFIFQNLSLGLLGERRDCGTSKGACMGTGVNRGKFRAVVNFPGLNELQAAKGNSRSPGQTKENLCLRKVLRNGSMEFKVLRTRSSH